MDQRYELARKRLELFNREELYRILENIDIICFDTFNYDDENKTYCPIAVAMNLHNTVKEPTNTKIHSEIAKKFTTVNIFKGTPGEFYTDTRKEDLTNLILEILNKRNNP